ncbi:MAG: hypothetical protein CMQ15_02240 [Gammaproteobacteria bacterium]|mgnify:CR=1 FL=1|jgi:hypothetical protein|nr:hypothetical protein [Gammaproteobacteria bacterium]HJN95751.1 DUF4105 domain-containing protein [Gammaproteobacteria bacterium]|tara:strand:+ start:10810 stop:12186 length:1377 start_codon:yes stop_codon:yes gene_type:complete
MIPSRHTLILQTLQGFARYCLPSLLIILTSIAAQAQTVNEELQQVAVPNDMRGVHFYLLTIDVGDRVWDNFGHTALRVHDETTNTDTVFNWGGFDMSEGVMSFSWNFFKGIMDYRLGTNSPSAEFAMYRSQERTVWQDKINLTNPQKEILYRRLIWNLEPDNIVYAYQYFSDNCTTKVRDYLDEALAGKISQQYTSVTDETFRDQVQSHYESVSLIGFSLDVLMNSNIDRFVSEWEELYLPLRFRERLLELKSDVAENGGQLMLLSDSQIIIEFAAPTIETDGYRVASLILVLPVILLTLMLKRIPQSYYATHSRFGLKAAAINFRILGLLALLTAVFSGIYGMLMLGSWFVSDHVDTHHNINLLLFWPTDLLGILVGLRWIILCRPWPMTHNSAPFINYYLLAHLIAMLAYASIAIFGLSQQSISDLALYVVPGFALFTVFIWVVGFQPAKPRNMFF